jgi:phosphohistidine swiveling domain-containing protein
MGIPRIFRKIGGQAQRMFSKVREYSPSILNKMSGPIASSMNTTAPIVSGIGVLTGQPELVGLGLGMKAVGGIAGGVNKLTAQNNNSLQKSNQVYGPQTGVIPQMNYAN